MRGIYFAAAIFGLVGLAGLVWASQFYDSPTQRPSLASSPLLGAEKISPAPLVLSTKISGIVVPHHDIVKIQRQEFMAKVATKIGQPKTIILVSPNHYESGRGLIQTTSQAWDTSEGSLAPNQAVISGLLTQGVTEEPGSFTNEHGIKLVLGDLRHNFPTAQIVPLIIKMETPKATIDELSKALNSDCPDCFMVASVDFSHYQPALLSNLHDVLSQRALENEDTDLLATRAEVDSPGSLILLADWAKSHQTEQFHLDNHTNSGIIDNNPDLESTSHLFGWYQSGAKTQPAQSVTFAIGGDMMFGRMIAHTFLKNGLEKSLDQLGDRVFWGTDAGIVNLEGPVSDEAVPDNIQPNNLTFNFPPQTIGALRFLKVNAASQANNHSANAGAAGLATTRQLLQQAAIQGIGGPGDKDIDKVASFAGEGLTLKVIGVHTLASIPDLKPLIQQLKADPNNRVLIFPHWGSEYLPKHTATQAKQAHDWIDAGADIVIGAHPHVVEDSELYKGKPIIYSMGNLLFDQTFSIETQQGLIVAGEFNEKGLQLFALPVQSNSLRPALARGQVKQTILDKLYQPFGAQIQTSPAGKMLFFPY